MALNLGSIILVVLNSIFYVLYLVLFAFSLRLILTRKNQAYQFHLSATITSFTCITIYGVMLTVSYFGIRGRRGQRLIGGFYHGSLLIAQLVADLILIARCYLIWDRRKSIVTLPLIGLTATTALGILGSTTAFLFESAELGTIDNGLPKNTILAAYTGSSLLTNSLITGLSAGRIWWISRKGTQIIGNRLKRRYGVATALIIESGLLYSIMLFALLSLHVTILIIPGGTKANSGLTFARGALIPLVVQMSGIAPTLLLVRIGLLTPSGIGQVPNSLDYTPYSNQRRARNQNHSQGHVQVVSTWY